MQVYKGTRGAEPVAVKVVTGQNERAVKDFKREVQMLMSLHCTVIVQFLGACITVRAIHHCLSRAWSMLSVGICTPWQQPACLQACCCHLVVCNHGAIKAWKHLHTVL